MNEVPPPLQPSEKLGLEAIAIAMFSSSSLEDLLKIFLTSLGERLGISRIAICHFVNLQEAKVLAEAISINTQSIKNQTYPISYFGIDSLQEYPSDRIVNFSDVSQIAETLTIHQYWQKTEVKAMMSVPIVFDLLTEANKIWGLAVVQQCDYPRQWQMSEAEFLLELSQVLGQCLQSWKLRLQSSTFSLLPLKKDFINNEISESDREEFVAKRIEITKDLEIASSQLSHISDGIAVSGSFILVDDDENKILNTLYREKDEATINHAINLALQKLDLQSKYSYNKYSSDFNQLENLQTIDGIDVESITLENVLEDVTQVKNQDKVEYLQKRVSELVESLQQKIDEIASLQIYIQEITESQKEFHQMLLNLQSENLTQTVKDSIIEMCQSLFSKQSL